MRGRPRFSCQVLVLGGLIPALAPLCQAQPPAPAAPADRVIEQSGVYEVRGELLPVIKAIIGGREVVLYDRGGLLLTPDELQRQLAGEPAPRIGVSLRRLLAQAAPTDLIQVVVYLSRQPAAPIARQVKAARLPAVHDLSAQIHDIVRKTMPAGSFSPTEEEELEPLPLSFEDRVAQHALSEERDQVLSEMRAEIWHRLQAAVADDQRRIEEAIQALGGRVRVNIPSVNAVGAELAVGRLQELAENPLVYLIDFDTPGAPELDNHKHSLGLVTGFWAAGLDGGVHDAGVLDTGVQQSHPAFAGKRFFSSAGTTDPDVNSHGTGICGILCSENATYTGMAFGVDAVIVAQASGTESVSMNGANSMLGWPESPENINYSFGNGRANDVDYKSFDAFFDAFIDTFDIMFSKSTGNGGYGTTTITHPAPAYNLMASANMDDFNTVTRSDDSIRDSSSRGPTLGGRKKPDITAPGHNSMTTNRTGGFSDLTGTSAASPHTGGGVILLTDMGLPNPTAAKAVLLNSALTYDDNGTQTPGDDGPIPGSRWNKTYGWGYLDLGKAYFNGLDVFVGVVDDTPEDADFKLYKGTMFDNEKATLAWKRHVAYSGATAPPQSAWEDLSDLDLTCWRESDNTPLAASESHIDNVEQIAVAADEQVVLKVEAFGFFDPNVDIEEFALATEENFLAAAGPAFAFGFDNPASVPPNQVFVLSVQVGNVGDVDAHNVQVTLGGIAVVAGANPQALGTIAEEGFATATWTVQAPPAPGLVVITANLASNSYGESFSAAGQSNMQVGQLTADFDGDGDVDLADFTLFQLCFGGSENPPAGTCPPGVDADLDGDGDVDLDDFLEFQLQFTGSL